MLEPLRGNKASVGALLDRSPDAATLLRELASASG
jgi:proteasome accessory factor A